MKENQYGMHSKFQKLHALLFPKIETKENTKFKRANPAKRKILAHAKVLKDQKGFAMKPTFQFGQ